MAFMRATLLLPMVFACTTTPRAAYPSRSEIISEDLEARPISGTPHWVITQTEPIAANSLVFLTSDGTPVLADTPWTAKGTADLVRWVRGKFGRTPGLATISHWHFDASGGISALQAVQIPIAISDHSLALLHEKGPGMRDDLNASHGPLFKDWVPPQKITSFSPDRPATWNIGGTRIEVLFLGGAHSKDNVVTWFPESRVLFGGCLVKGGKSLGYLGDADMESYPKVVDRLMSLEPEIVVPGHGKRLDPDQLQNTKVLLHNWHHQTPSSKTARR